jgi:hypothetical protein
MEVSLQHRPWGAYEDFGGKVTDASLKPDPYRKGSYYRRIEDIRRALDTLDVSNLPPTPRFVAYFFGCEKLAHGIVGIVSCRPAISQYNRHKWLELNNIKLAASAMELHISASELEWIFADFKQQKLLEGGLAPASARVLRNNLIHNFGPSNVKKIVLAAPVLIPMMERFLNCTDDVFAHLQARFAHG